MLKPKTLKQKVTFYLILIGVFPLILVFLCSWRLLTFSLGKIELNRLTGLAESARVAVEKHIEARVKDIQLLARNPILTDRQAAIDEKLEEMRKAEEIYGIFDDITLIDPDGDVVASVYYRYRGEWASKECFQKALTGETAISKVHIIPDPTKVIMIFAAPVVDKNGQTTAVVAGQMNMEEIWNLTDNIKIGTSGCLTITEAHGNFIACPDKSNLLRPASFRYSESKAVLPYFGRSIIGYSPMGLLKESKLPEWYFAAILSEREAFAPVRIVSTLLGIVGFISLVFVFIGSKIFSRDVINPIEKLARETKWIMKGNLAQRIRLKAKNEIGDLAISFNKLTEWFAKTLRRVDEARARAENIFQAQVDMVLTLSDDGILVSINKSALQTLGYRADDIVGKNFSMLLANEEKGNFHNFLQQCRRGKIIRGVETTMVLADSRKITVNFNVSLIRNAEGKAKGVVVVARNITEKKKIEEKVGYMASLVESAAHCIISTDKEGTITSINNAGEIMFGYKAEELIGKPVSILQSDQVSEDLLNRLNEFAQRGESWEAESLGRRKNGEVFPIWLATSYLRDKEGKVKGAVGISRDLTEFKEYEEKLKHMAELVESAAQCVISTDKTNRILTINKAGEKMLGYQAKEIMGKDVSMLYREETPKRTVESISKKAERGENWDAEVFRRKKNGEVFPAWVSTSYLFDERGQKKGALSIMRNLTEIKRLERDLVHADRLATIGTMATGIAHEIRNPLAGIEIGLEALSDKVQKDKEDAEVIETLHDEIMGLNQVVSRLLEYGRKRSDNILPLDVAEVFRKTLFFLHKQIRDNRVTVDWKVEEDLRQINANGASLQQAFMNIMLNSIQAMESGGLLKISARNKLLKGRKFVEIVFEDTGEGIAQENIPKIFDAFTTKSGGTGLGLPISKKIIEDFDGSIEVKSQKDQGTAVSVTLPAITVQ